MENTRNGVYLGIDLNDRYTMISFYQLNMDEPSTISTVMGSENYQIPTFLAKKRGIGQWFYGSEARNQVKLGNAEGVDKLLERALAEEEIFIDHEKYNARDLFIIFFKKILSITGRIYTGDLVAKLAISVDNVSVEVMELMATAVNKIGLDSSKLILLDRKESFYYYALNQKPELFIHDVALFEYSGSDVISCILSRDTRSTPQMIKLEHGNNGRMFEDKDSQFAGIVRQRFEGRVISSVYLVGDGFDGDWMKLSLQELCHGRKVFIGKNLYSKGACYAGVVKDQQMDWPFAYIGANETKMNLYLKVLVRNEMQFETLISAGESWYEEKGECEVILDGEPEIEFWVQQPDSREAHVELLELTDLPARDRRTTRLRITATPTSDRDVNVVIKDMGFGELVPSSNKTWEHTISLRGQNEEDESWVS